MPTTPNATDVAFMKLALSLAQTAGAFDEVPVGAIIMNNTGHVIATGFNRRETRASALSHAELEAIQVACQRLGSWRLQDCTMYVTLEPCLMCAGAIYQARLSKVVFAAADPKGGALGSLYEIQSDRRLNHNFEVVGGICADESTELLQSFFRARRVMSREK